MKKSKRPRDTNALAKAIVDLATGQAVEVTVEDSRNVHAVELGRLGGLKGGKARAEKMTPEERSEAARKAAQKRWGSNIVDTKDK